MRASVWFVPIQIGSTGIKTFVTLVNALIPFPSMALRALPYIEKGMWAQEGFVAIT